MTREQAQRRESTERSGAWGLLAGSLTAAALLSFRPIYEPDLWWHLAQGRENAAGHLVRTNLFSFTYPDHRQPYNSWLFDLAAYLSWQGLGPTGIQVLQAVFVTLSLVTLFAACRMRAPAWSAAAVLAIGLFVIEPRAIPRPHLLSFAAFAGCTLLIETAAARRSAAPLWWAVVLLGLWSNAHVECVFGVVLLFAFAASEWAWPRRLPRAEAGRALLIAAIAAAATLLNPYGLGLWQYLYENLSVQGVVAIAELLPPSLPAYRAFYAYVALTGVLLILDRRGFALSDAVVFAVFAVFGVMHLRETPLVLFASAPLAAQRLAGLTDRGIDYRALLVTSLCAGLALSRIPPPVLLRGFAVGAEAVEPPQFFSTGAVDFARRTGLSGPLFNSVNLGGYVAWKMYPAARVFQDTRFQAYPPDHFRTIVAASASQDEWNRLVAGVDWAMVSVPRPNQLSGIGRFPVSEWRSVYQDDAIEIVVRKSGRFGP
jgi:hypothetical protein